MTQVSLLNVCYCHKFIATIPSTLCAKQECLHGDPAQLVKIGPWPGVGVVK
ncbi:hypothetical protein CI610_03422 [invertebrate metagenome]|uniref:Uncharacterized protein n=1 Tax=invertebrate metagenome TaxID=1711999 RepID=A0A2H9T351_9ZZZZ